MESLLTRDDAAHIICMVRQERDRYRANALHGSKEWHAMANALQYMAYDILRYVRRALHKSPIKMI